MILEFQIQKMFDTLQMQGGTLPQHGIMSDKLGKMAPKKGSLDVSVKTEIVKLFATASIEMWLRAIHSFLISTALTNASPLWASISGYYSSHYTIRALAHLLGIYQLRKNRSTVTLQSSRTGFICSFKEGRNREHSFYWKMVKQHPNFFTDSLFTENPEDTDISDAGHRNFATYIDHLNKFPNFSPLTYDELEKRIVFISKFEMKSYPIPMRTNYPDTDSVQIIAYHRLVYFRELIDSVLGDSNRFWSVHRNPSWCRGIIDFQRIKPQLIASIGQQ